MCTEGIVQIKCQHVAGVAFSVRLKFHKLGTVGLVELYMFGSWYDTPLFRDVICLLDILKHRNMFQTRDTEQKVQAAYTATQNVVG
jgi:hypothetical protein